MSHLDPARKTTPSELRKFGLLVGGALLVLAAVFAWRQKPTAMISIFATAGVALVATGLVAPRVLASVYDVWMRFALLLSKVTTPVFMGVIYFVVLTPVGLIMRALGRQPLRLRQTGTTWTTRAEGARASALDRQF